MFCLNFHPVIVFLYFPELLCCPQHEELAVVTWANQMPLHQGGAACTVLPEPSAVMDVFASKA